MVARGDAVPFILFNRGSKYKPIVVPKESRTYFTLRPNGRQLVKRDAGRTVDRRQGQLWKGGASSARNLQNEIPNGGEKPTSGGLSRYEPLWSIDNTST